MSLQALVELIAWLVSSITLLVVSVLTQRQINLNIAAIRAGYSIHTEEFLAITMSDRFEEALRGVAYIAALIVGLQAAFHLVVWEWLLVLNLGILAINSVITYVRNVRRLRFWKSQAIGVLQNKTDERQSSSDVVAAQ